MVNSIGVPENIFIGYNGNVNIACASGLGFPVEYINKLGQSAIKEQRERMDKRKSLSVLEDLDTEGTDVPSVPKKQSSKRKKISLDFLNSL